MHWAKHVHELAANRTVVLVGITSSVPVASAEHRENLIRAIAGHKRGVSLTLLRNNRIGWSFECRGFRRGLWVT